MCNGKCMYNSRKEYISPTFTAYIDKSFIHSQYIVYKFQGSKCINKDRRISWMETIIQWWWVTEQCVLAVRGGNEPAEVSQHSGVVGRRMRLQVTEGSSHSPPYSPEMNTSIHCDVSTAWFIYPFHFYNNSADTFLHFGNTFVTNMLNAKPGSWLSCREDRQHLQPIPQPGHAHQIAQAGGHQVWCLHLC